VSMSASRDIVVAQSVSSNGHTYSEGALIQMAHGLRGRPVLSKEPRPEDSEDSTLQLACGIVIATEVLDGKVIVAVAWFEGKRPSEKYLTPTGTPVALKDAVITAYQPAHLTISGSSAFEEATKLL
jgi:hypothetical protein